MKAIGPALCALPMLVQVACEQVPVRTAAPLIGSSAPAPQSPPPIEGRVVQGAPPERTGWPPLVTMIAPPETLAASDAVLSTVEVDFMGLPPVGASILVQLDSFPPKRLSSWPARVMLSQLGAITRGSHLLIAYPVGVEDTLFRSSAQGSPPAFARLSIVDDAELPLPPSDPKRLGAELCRGGCPWEDADQDGVPATDDLCPEQAETTNGFEDGDGCPDAEWATATLLANKVYFQSGSTSLQQDAFEALGRLAKVLTAASSTIRSVELVGHADKRGDFEDNAALSLKRAEAARDWLVRHGVAAENLVAVGAGALPGEAKAVMDANRRVEIRARVERRVGIGEAQQLPEFELASGWRIAKRWTTGRTAIFDPQGTVYLPYSAKQTGSRWAVFARAAVGKEVDLVFERPEPLRASWRLRAASGIGNTAAEVVESRTEGKAGAPPLRGFTDDDRTCRACGAAPALLVHEPRGEACSNALLVDIAVLGLSKTDVQPRVQMTVERGAASRSFLFAADAPERLEGLSPGAYAASFKLVDESGSAVPQADTPRIIRFQIPSSCDQ